MDTDYDRIAEQYQRAKLQPWRTHIERYTLLQLAGDVAGKTVIDLACGEGYYTRALREQGAARIIGVDLSRAMIGLAEAEETRRPLGIEVTSCYLSVETMEEAFGAAGLREVRWHAPEVSPEGLRQFGPEHWADFRARPPVAFIECVK